VREHSERQAEPWLREGLRAAGLATEELPRLKGSDPRKLLLAELLWKRTTVSQEWLAQKLWMSSGANVSQQLRRMDRRKALAKAPPPLKLFLEEIKRGDQ
jgi:hypothetical protein